MFSANGLIGLACDVKAVLGKQEILSEKGFHANLVFSSVRPKRNNIFSNALPSRFQYEFQINFAAASVDMNVDSKNPIKLRGSLPKIRRTRTITDVFVPLTT